MINVAFCADDKYVVPASVLIESLLEHNDGSDVAFYTVANDLSAGTREKFNRIVTGYGSTIHYIEMPNDILNVISEYKIGVSYISRAAFYRLLLPYLLDSDIQRLLYLDCDILIQGDIQPLFDTDLDGKTIAGVLDFSSTLFAERLHIDKYINSGVLLIDVDRWKSLYPMEEILNAIKKLYMERELQQGDQDIINLLFEGSIKFVSDKFNFQRHISKSFSWHHKELVKKAVIVHFITGRKPWTYAYCYPYTRAYYAYWKQYITTKTKMKYWVFKPIAVVKNWLCVGRKGSKK